MICKLGNIYFNLDKIVSMTKPYCDDYVNEIGQTIKSCQVFINGKEYYRTNFLESYSIIVDDDTEKNYQEFKDDAIKLFEAFITQKGV